MTVLVLTFMISMFSSALVFVSATTDTTGCTTVTSDVFADNVVYADIVSCTGNAKMTVSSDADNGTMVFTPVDSSHEGGVQLPSVYINGGNWAKTGYVEMTYDITFNGTLNSGDYFDFGFGMTASNGTARDWILSPNGDSRTSFESGVTKNIKYVVQFTSTTTSVAVYEKLPSEIEWAQCAQQDKSFGPAAGYEYIREFMPYPYYKISGGSEVSATISNLCVTEMYTTPIIQELGGNYLNVESVDVNYYLPIGYDNAVLTMDDITIVTFDGETDAYGCYKTSVDLLQYDISGDNIPIALRVVLADQSTSEKISYISVSDPVTEASMEDISGEYGVQDTVEVSYALPYGYASAQLTVGDEVIASYNADDNRSGNYTSEFCFDDYDIVGENIPVSLIVNFDDADNVVITYYVDVIFVYEEVEFRDVSGIYTTRDTLVLNYIIPRCEEAKLYFNDELITTHTEMGKYSTTVNIAEMNVSGADIPLKLVVSYADSDDEIYESTLNIIAAMGERTILTENFDGEDFTMVNGNPNTLSEHINRTEFDSAVYHVNFNSDNLSGRNTLIKWSLAITATECVDITYDVNLSNTNISSGLHGKYTNSDWYNNSYYLQTAGKFMGKDYPVYAADEWHNVHWRIIPAGVIDSEDSILVLYVDGEYVGEQPCAYDSGFAQINIETLSGGVIGDAYYDNVKITIFSTAYKANLNGVDADGNISEKVDYTNPKFAVEFNQVMMAATFDDNSVKLFDYNNVEIECIIDFDEDDNMLYVVPKADLVPGAEYTIAISSSVLSATSTYHPGGLELSISATDMPYRIDEIDVNLDIIPDNTEFNVNIIVMNDNNEDISAVLFVALYSNGGLKCINTCPVGGTESEQNYSVPLKTPDDSEGDYEVSAYIMAAHNDYTVVAWK